MWPSTLRNVWALGADQITNSIADRTVAARTRDDVRLLKDQARQCRFVSLGNDCYAAALLKKWKLKHSSMPFDWIFSNNAMISHCIKDNFKRFLDPSLFKTIPIEARQNKKFNKCDHLFYKSEFDLPNMFNHRDPTNPEELEYYRRCVRRFIQLYDDERPTVFVSIFRNSTTTNDDFLGLEQELKTRMTNFLLVGVAINDQRGDPPRGAELYSSRESVLLHMRAKSRWTAERFEAADDDIHLHTSLCRTIIARSAPLADCRSRAPDAVSALAPTTLL